ncbi:MAG: TIGR04053 family radical SAM/SPASM domain-containing protein [Nitrososphaerota archaeon]|nr:TIGR04053 family radical SAM/SPASM domain-containing protein [Nitrososphaerota archaeon]
MGRFEDRPVLVFWEMTRACPLFCLHCRASAVSEPLPGELTTKEGFELIDQVASFDKPTPTIIFTGGDPLKRKDLFEILNYASERGVKFAVSPAVSENLNMDSLGRIKETGASAISISLDGAKALTHDSIRRRDGSFKMTLEAISNALKLGLKVQVNTAVMKRNFEELPDIFALIKDLGVETWELFFLVQVGRGSGVEDLDPDQYESVCNFLYDASRYGILVRCVEAPFIRRVVRLRMKFIDYWGDGAYIRMRSRLTELCGEPEFHPSISLSGTLDGDGVVFVAYDGTVNPGGLLPLPLGDIRNDRLVDIYRQDKLLKEIRARQLHGLCGSCEFSSVCGGSRARAYSYFGDPLASDPACIMVSNLSS